jgi:hypothetical protein
MDRKTFLRLNMRSKNYALVLIPTEPLIDNELFLSHMPLFLIKRDTHLVENGSKKYNQKEE